MERESPHGAPCDASFVKLLRSMTGMSWKSTAVAALIWAPASLATAQQNAVQTTVTTGTVFLPIEVAKVSDLSFGVVLKPMSGSGTVTIDPADGSRSHAGAGGLLNGGSAGRAEFLISGEGGQTYSVNVPATLQMNHTGGPGSLLVTLVPTSAVGTLANGLGSAGSAGLGVGGSVTVNEATPSGAYSGSFEVVVAYD